VAHHQKTEAHQQQEYSRQWVNGQIATGKRFIPNVPVISHLGENKLFYDHLVKNRTVIVQFMSIAHYAGYPVTRNLAQVQRLLRGRLGKDVFLYSITADPLNDTPQALARFATQFSPGPGWLFLTGDQSSLAALKNAFFVHPGGHHHHDGASNASGHNAAHAKAMPKPDCSMGLMRYGNDASGLWGSVPTKTDPAMIVERLSWVIPNPVRPKNSPLRRGGPFPTNA
jgi:protein SCO1/2